MFVGMEDTGEGEHWHLLRLSIQSGYAKNLGAIVRLRPILICDGHSCYLEMDGQNCEMKHDLAIWPNHVSFGSKFSVSGRLVIWQLAARRGRSELLDECLALKSPVESYLRFARHVESSLQRTADAALAVEVESPAGKRRPGLERGSER
jgi:hypothetical protein